LGDAKKKRERNFIQGLNKKLHHLKRFRIAATALHGMGEIPHRGYRFARNGRDSASRHRFARNDKFVDTKKTAY
jgi:hypothetical protein